MWIHHTYDQVLEALAAVGPATTTEILCHLEGRRQLNGNVGTKKRRRWLWQALLNLANSGRVEYVIERGVYVWRARSLP